MRTMYTFQCLSIDSLDILIEFCTKMLDDKYNLPQFLQSAIIRCQQFMLARDLAFVMKSNVYVPHHYLKNYNHSYELNSLGEFL